jgi:GAF domain-containing protein
VLQLIVDAARELAGAQYAALGVPNAEGYLDAFIYSGMTPEQARRIPHFPKGLGLLGAIVRNRQTIRLPRLSDDPRSIGFPAHHPPMESFLGVPVMAGHKMKRQWSCWQLMRP